MRIYPGTTVDYEFATLGGLGYTGTLNDRQFAALRAEGLTGSLADMFMQSMGGFSPAALFAASEQGAWLDPSDLSTLYQDTAGTTPVTAAGQAVGMIRDKSGRGNHATQATAGDRPLYENDGRGYLSNVSSDTMGATMPNLGTDATLAYCDQNGVTILANQTISGAVTLPTSTKIYWVIYLDRVLTEAERLGLIAYGEDLVAEFYADSVAGLDAYDGLSSGRAKQTIAGLHALSPAAGKRVGLADDSYWLEQYKPGVALQSVKSRGLATLDGADVIDPGDFTLSAHVDAGGVTYEVTLSVDPNAVLVSGDTYMMWENDEWLVRRTSVALVAANPGSFYLPSPNASISTPRLAYVHPFGSTNPTSDGKTYEASKRAAGLELASVDGVTVEGIHATRGLSAYGPLPMGNGTVRRCLISKGGKHNIVQAAGLIEDTICFDAEIGRSVLADGGLIPYTFYKPNTTGLSWEIRRSMSICPVGRTITSGAVYSHNSAGPNYSSGTIEGFISLRGGAVEGVQTEQYLNDICALDVGNGRAVLLGAASSVIELRRALIRSAPLAGAVEINHPAAGAITGAAVEVSHCALHKPTGTGVTTGSGAAFNATSVVNFHHNVIFAGAGATPVSMQVAQAGSQFRFNIIVINQAGTREWGRWHSNVAMDYNVYINNTGASDYWWQTPGSGTAFSLTEWRTESGKDTNSVELNAAQAATLFLNGVAGMANGDFRLDPACPLTFVDGTPLVGNAGPQEYYDWNTRTVEVGQPSRWPVPPATLAECETYITDPTAWDFYP